jgi:hypothetical protein
MLRNIFWPTRDEVTGELRRLHNEELYAFYFSPNLFRVIKSKRMRWMGPVAYKMERRGAHSVLVDIPEGTKSLGRPMFRREDIIKMDLKK